MAEIHCSRCDATTEGLPKPPLPGEVGELLHARTCPACWRLWLDHQVKVINEYTLSPAKQEHYDFLVKEMRKFLEI